MIKVNSKVKHLLSLASRVKKELGTKPFKLTSPFDKIIFLLSHANPEGALGGATLLAKLCCLFDVLILGWRDYLVIDNFGPEDINFSRELSLSALNRFIHLQTIEKKRYAILTPRGYSYFKKNMVKSPHLTTLLGELQEFADKVDSNLINLAYFVVFHLDGSNEPKKFDNSLREIPWVKFIQKDSVVYNSLIYNFLRYRKYCDFSKNPAASLTPKEATYIPKKYFHLPKVKNSLLEGDTMKDSQSSVFPYLEAISCFTSITGKLPALLDIASIAFARTNYYNTRIRDEGLYGYIRQRYKERRDAIISVTEEHLNKMEERGFIITKKVGEKVYYQNAAKVFFDEDLTFETFNKSGFEECNRKISEYIAKCKGAPKNENKDSGWPQKWLQYELDYFILGES